MRVVREREKMKRQETVRWEEEIESAEIVLRSVFKELFSSEAPKKLPKLSFSGMNLNADKTEPSDR